MEQVLSRVGEPGAELEVLAGAVASGGPLRPSLKVQHGAPAGKRRGIV